MKNFFKVQEFWFDSSNAEERSKGPVKRWMVFCSDLEVSTIANAK